MSAEIALPACNSGHDRGTSSNAATISTETRLAPSTPPDNSVLVSSRMSSPTVRIPVRDFSMTSLTEAILDVRTPKRIDQRLDVSIQKFRQLVHRVPDAMIGYAVLRKVVRANFR